MLNIDWITNTNGYNLQNPLSVFCTVQKSTSLSLPANTPTTITGFTSIVQGSLPGFDLSAGSFTSPDNGLYLYNLYFTISGASTNLDILIRILDLSDVQLFGSCQRITNDNTIALGFIGNGQYLTIGSGFKFQLRTDTNGITLSNATIKVIKLFGT